MVLGQVGLHLAVALGHGVRRRDGVALPAAVVRGGHELLEGSHMLLWDPGHHIGEDAAVPPICYLGHGLEDETHVGVDIARARVGHAGRLAEELP
eukprot:15461727-Alexandrium_andersonii.AAC.1